MKDTVRDTGNLAYIICFWEGVGNLLPWNAFITASSYFGDRFCGTAYADTFMNYFSFSYTFSQTIGLLGTIYYLQNVPVNIKVIYPLILYSTIFAAITILVTSDMNGEALFWITLIATFLSGLCGSMLTGGLFGVSAHLPPKYTAALCVGQGLAGLGVSLCGLVTIAAGPDTSSCTEDALEDSSCDFKVNYSALAYFMISTLVLFSCVFSFIAFLKLPFTRYYLDVAEPKDVGSNPMIEKNSKTEKLLVFDQACAESTVTVISAIHVQDSSCDDGEVVVDNNSSHGMLRSLCEKNKEGDASDLNSADSQTFARVLRVLWIIRIPAFSVFFIYVVSIGLFPALVVLIESDQKCNTNDRFHNDLYVPFLFVIWNLFDFAGRVFGGQYPSIFKLNAHNIWIASVSRVVFFPLFLFCNVSENQLPVLFKSCAFPILFIAGCASTNGYVSTLSMMFGPSLADNDDASLAGNIMVFCLTAGLLTGALLSFLVVFIAQGTI